MEENRQHVVIDLNMEKLATANFVWSIILSVLFVTLNILVHRKFDFHFHFLDLIFYTFLFFIGYVILIVLHEGFHLLGFILFGKAKLHELDYGINLKLGVAYATTKKPLLNKEMKKALLLPFWTTGVIPTVIGFMLGSNLIVLLGAWLIAGAIGDFYMYKELRKYPKDCFVKDDPQLPKLYVFCSK